MKIEELKVVNKLVEELRSYRHVVSLMKRDTNLVINYSHDTIGKAAGKSGGVTNINLNDVEANSIKYLFDLRIDHIVAKLKQYGVEE